MDNAPSGALLINMFGGRWEMEAIWALKVAMTVDDWKEPLYTWYLLENVCEEEGNTNDVVTIGLINTCPSKR